MKKQKRTLHLILTALCFSAVHLAAGDPPPQNGQPPLPPIVRELPQEEQNILAELRKNDPAAFKQKVMELLRKKRTEEIQEALAIRKQFLNAGSPDAAEAIRTGLKTKISEKFDRHLKNAEQRIAENEARLRHMQNRNETFKQEIQRRKKDRDAIIQKIMDDLLNPDKEPDFKPPRRKK